VRQATRNPAPTPALTGHTWMHVEAARRFGDILGGCEPWLIIPVNATGIYMTWRVKFCKARQVLKQKQPLPFVQSTTTESSSALMFKALSLAPDAIKGELMHTHPKQR
jgi:hypothetical protein